MRIILVVFLLFVILTYYKKGIKLLLTVGVAAEILIEL